MQLVEHTVYTFVTQYVCICVVSWFSAKMFFNRKVKATRSTALTIFNRDLLPLLLLHLYKQIFFSYMEKLCCFCDIGSTFFYVFFKKCSKIFVTLIYESEQKSSLRRRKSHLRGPRFQNFTGEDTPDPPTNARSYVCISQLSSWIRPWFSS
jgi:hypothetical protein